MATEEKIEIARDELKALLESNRKMMAEMQEMRKHNEFLAGNQEPFRGPRTSKKVTKKEIRITLVGGKLVVGYKNRGIDSRPSYIYEAPDPQNPTKTLLYVDLILRGEKEPLKVQYNEFLRDSEKRNVVVKEIKEEEWSIEQGIIKKKELPDGHYSTYETDEDVLVEIIGKTRRYVIDLDGEEVSIDENYVNI